VAHHRRRAAPVAAVIALVLVAALGVVVVTRGGDPGGEPAVAVTGPIPPPPPPTPSLAPDPPTTDPTSPGPTAAPTEPATTPTDPGPFGPPPEGLDQIAREVAALRGLPYDAPLDARVVPAAALGEKFTSLALADLDPDQVAADQRLLVALRLLAPDDDLLGALDALYREQVLGLYVTEERRLYIGADSPALSPYRRGTAAHEIVHALQDRAFDILAMRDVDDRESDAALAIISLLEGDAVLAQQQWTIRHQTADERRRAREEATTIGGTALRAAPRYVREAVFFPYTEGVRFVTALLDAGGWTRVDAALAEPPTATAHIYHPERYLAGEQPLAVTVTATPGVGWQDAATYTFGEFDVRELLVGLGADVASAVGSGWAGGEVRAWQRGGDDAVALRLAFRDEAAGRRGCAELPRWYAEVARGTAPAGTDTATGVLASERDWFAWTCTATEVQVAVAPDRATATRLAAAAGGG
jgi:hypothetical protein